MIAVPLDTVATIGTIVASVVAAMAYMRGFRSDLDVRFDRLDAKIDTVADRLDAKIDTVADRLETKIDGVADRLDA